MLKEKTFLLIALVVSLTTVQAQTQQYTIVGKLKGYKDGTFLYLHDVSNGNYKPIDSTTVANEKFVFQGDIQADHIRAAISTTDLSDRVTFWLEKGQTSISAKRNKFDQANISGSTLQTDHNMLNKDLAKARDPEEIEFRFVKNNPKSILSAYILSVYRGTWKRDKVLSLYNAFTAEVKSSPYAQKVIEFITANQDIKVGDKFFDFSQEDTAYRAVFLSSIKDKVVLLEFWGSWCGPCREENPKLLNIYNEFASKGFEIFGVASETDRSQWIKAINVDRLTWINVTDLKGSSNKAAMMYGVTAYPTNFLIDKTGTIIAKDVYGEGLRKWLLSTLP